MGITTRVGQTVMNANGDIGIVTEDVKLSGRSKGKLFVQLAGMYWQTAEDPSELEVIEIIRKPSQLDS